MLLLFVFGQRVYAYESLYKCVRDKRVQEKNLNVPNFVWIFKADVHALIYVYLYIYFK